MLILLYNASNLVENELRMT